MASIFVTGSAAGIGLETGRQLAAAGHRVVLHARDPARAQAAGAALPAAAATVTGDVSTLAGIREVAQAAFGHGPYDAVIHNVGVGGAGGRRVSADGFEHIFAVNALAPYLLTALLPLPPRLIYLTSGLESEGRVDLSDLQHERGPWDGMRAYRDSKLCDVLLAFAVARRWPQIRSNAVDPGWIRTKLGGAGATGELPEGAATQVWLATSASPAAAVSGRYFRNQRELRANPAAYDVDLQEGLLAACAALTGAELPPPARA